MLILILQGCSIVSYKHVYPNGHAYEIWACALGTTKSLEDFKLKASPEGEKILEIGKYDSDQTEAIKKAVEGAVAAAIAAGKP